MLPLHCTSNACFEFGLEKEKEISSTEVAAITRFHLFIEQWNILLAQKRHESISVSIKWTKWKHENNGKMLENCLAVVVTVVVVVVVDRRSDFNEFECKEEIGETEFQWSNRPHQNGKSNQRNISNFPNEMNKTKLNDLNDAHWCSNFEKAVFRRLVVLFIHLRSPKHGKNNASKQFSYFIHFGSPFSCLFVGRKSIVSANACSNFDQLPERTHIHQ